ncbi:CidA/LrgA family protein [Robertmurraya yapensis]|uniref:CidA/LrgA family protein n=2 Tax=Bacillaceae TaxID=186817 RepID=A0A3S0KMN1_9BACI|nr:CidA/LrgA family protein [Bacillus yapensis]RTR33870.1 CidA/LrgA family protein [Bacillus yapensis]TKS97188.1 CidA/LrgA family holin-like protein [Bacillus yapensis]
MKILMIALQILFIHVFLYLGAGVKALLGVPIPASMIGLFLLFIALCLKIVKLEWVEKGAGWLIAELLLFFVPSAVGIINYDDIFSLQGLETILLIGVSTFIVMGTTAFVADKIFKRKDRETA